ncbi:MAG: hypothetical protein GX869_06335 [Candidatus Cloacimonetes bacterium]|jgi:hypothetical protein|uniref:hypothetical protein n=1 Tax=Candidatus Syntrophosphaera thermopropionivorans TaxID=2593015 RepID=UPI0014055ECB|nr:hypothetical protein [Candidatus Syntrophosphaera thermopropionivorans]MBP7899549.1 hypothetical protein [Candidatus Syntrophosphaera sp.]NLA44587.1 hypothetical protein [Candidatus Cloacimonadota bacterium]NLA45246.1 hypothetical protein [Candidatus Cloacimonadota bacterium]HOR30349.1 hypothetical protein [Candidatus Syntrophosphaera thermopropionivorans]HOT39694.1 hypothetical protein [Candidatus Syntrophosphaera thermopropionivorans]
MNENMLHNIAEELAKKVNKALNLPILNEQQEQAFFEMVILLLLELLINKLGLNLDVNN